MTEDIVRPLVLTLRLLARFWPQLLLVASLGYIARDLLMSLAVGVGLHNPLGGMVVLSLVVLTKLLVVVLMFSVLRPGLPALASLRHAAAAPAPARSPRWAFDETLAVAAAAILPFFAYYAAWGFLGDTVREYTRLALARVPFGESADILDLLPSGGLIASIAACWGVRWLARRMSKRSTTPWWRLLVVAADASWIFIGLYALGVWKDEFITWLGAGALLDEVGIGLQSLSLSGPAHAAESFTPVEFRQPALFDQLRTLFFYALLPMVWLVMAAIVNGYELSAAPAAATTASATDWRKWLRDFAAHFIGGYRSRYAPVWACLKLTLGAGLATLITFVVAYRLLNWLGAWAWYGATRAIGAHDLVSWQVFADVIGLFIGSPSDLDGGILLDAARIGLLAAVLEHAVAAGRRPQAVTAG